MESSESASALLSEEIFQTLRVTILHFVLERDATSLLVPSSHSLIAQSVPYAHLTAIHVSVYTTLLKYFSTISIQGPFRAVFVVHLFPFLYPLVLFFSLCLLSLLLFVLSFLSIFFSPSSSSSTSGAFSQLNTCQVPTASQVVSRQE